jgi:hypothetical protein
MPTNTICIHVAAAVLLTASSSAFAPPATIPKIAECSTTSTVCCAASNRRDALRSILFGGFTASTFSIETWAADDQVETKSPLIEVFKSFLPDDNHADSSSKENNPLDFISWDGPKKRGLNPEQMADAINDGLREREWFVTGKGLPEFYSDNFSFSDPQVSLMGYEQYCRQVRRLFDQETARCEVVCCSVTAPDTITVLWRNSGRVNIGPVGVMLKPYVVTTQLKMDPNDGNLIVSQVDDFNSDGAGLLLYQIPFLRPLAGAPAANVDVLRTRCDFYTCKLKS